MLHSGMKKAALAALVFALANGFAVAQEKDMVMYGAAGSIASQTTTHILPPFEAKNGVKITYQGVPAGEVLSKSMAMRTSPEASMAIANDLVAAVGAKNGLWEKLDPNLVPTLSNIPSWAVLNEGTAVATGVTAVGIVYNKQIFEEKGLEPPTSFEDIFRDDLAGHVVVYDIGFGLMPPALYSWNLALGGTYDDLSPVFNKFRDNKSKILTFAASASAWEQMFQQGIAWIGINSVARAGILRDQGIPVEFVYPKEGAAVMFAPAMVPVGAEESELGQRLIDYYLQPDVQALYASTQYYAPVHPDAKLEPKVLEFVPSADDISKSTFLDWLRYSETLPEAARLWARTVMN